MLRFWSLFLQTGLLQGSEESSTEKIVSREMNKTRHLNPISPQVEHICAVHFKLIDPSLFISQNAFIKIQTILIERPRRWLKIKRIRIYACCAFSHSPSWAERCAVQLKLSAKIEIGAFETHKKDILLLHRKRFFSWLSKSPIILFKNIIPP